MREHKQILIPPHCHQQTKVSCKVVAFTRTKGKTPLLKLR